MVRLTSRYLRLAWTFATTLSVAAFLLMLAGPGIAAARAEEVWLDSLDLSKAQQGFGTPHAGKSVEGNPLSIAGRKFEHGFGTHSIGILRINLNGGSTRFQALVGIDDEVQGKPGTVEFEVIGDGKSLWKSGLVKSGEAARPVDVDLRGVKTLLLLVGDHGDGYFFDHSDWADARFEVTGARPVTTDPVPPDSTPVIIASGSPATPRINGARIIGAVPGKPVLYTIAATGERPMVFGARGLPRGLRLDTRTGQISGTLARTGDYPFEVAARNSKGVVHARLLFSPGAALTPPMGWNSYDAFGDGVTESEVRANARYIAANLQPHGWDTVVIDYRWYDPGAGPGENGQRLRGAPLAMDANGRLQPAPNRFPSATGGNGFGPLADEIHALGLKFGIHIMRGIPRQAVNGNTPIEGSAFTAAEAGNPNNKCSWNSDMFGVDASKPAGQAWYDSIFRQYAAWGLDFVKVDDLSAPYSTLEIEAIRKAIDRCGRSIVFSTSPGETPIEQAGHIKTHANMWRVSGDFWDDWGSLNHAFDLAFRWMGVGGPGHWPDEDMLTVGHLSVANRSVGPDRRTKFSQSEQVTLITLWSILPSPLMLGANLPDTDPWTLALLTNDEVLAINQDPLALPATRVSAKDGLEVWSRPLTDGSLAVALFNRGYVEQQGMVRWADLKLNGRHLVRDLWQQKDLGHFADQFAAMVRPHGAVLVRISGAS